MERLKNEFLAELAQESRKLSRERIDFKGI